MVRAGFRLPMWRNGNEVERAGFGRSFRYQQDISDGLANMLST